jgi:hypothetical protein
MSNIKFEHNQNNIYISNPDWGQKYTECNRVAITEFTSELWEIIKNNNWTVIPNKKKTNFYLYSQKLKKSLHHIVVIYWYGKEPYEAFMKKGFVVDHFNNNGFDCRVSNLEFIPRGINSRKGHTFDISAKKNLRKFSHRFSKDIIHNNYRLMLFINDKHSVEVIGKERILDNVAKIELSYPDNYLVLLDDCDLVQEDYKKSGKIDLTKLHYKAEKITYFKQVMFIGEIENFTPSWVRINGEIYLVKNPSFARMDMDQAIFDKSWDGETSCEEQ